MNTIKPNYQKVYIITPASSIILYFVSLVFIIVGVKFFLLSGLVMLIGFAFIALGFVVFLNIYNFKVILRADSIEIKSIFKHKIIQNHEILYFKRQLSGTNGFHIIGLKPSSKRPIYLPLSLKYDNKFFAWFNGIPDSNNTSKHLRKSGSTGILHSKNKFTTKSRTVLVITVIPAWMLEHILVTGY